MSPEPAALRDRIEGNELAEGAYMRIGDTITNTVHYHLPHWRRSYHIRSDSSDTLKKEDQQQQLQRKRNQRWYIAVGVVFVVAGLVVAIALPLPNRASTRRERRHIARVLINPLSFTRLTRDSSEYAYPYHARRQHPTYHDDRDDPIPGQVSHRPRARRAVHGRLAMPGAQLLLHGDAHASVDDVLREQPLGLPRGPVREP
ncbi:uncharacterized protein PG998_003124 [Apiospora kogelbergensis]|uniref:uncharacterized protein n=1 Tax=Apiospora kogelbergensis TaxID=1337665 RepID=UPI003130B823